MAPKSLIAPPRASAAENLVTVVLSAWLILGLFVDGWAHNNAKPESFFTPWHGLFYSGYAATAAWMWSRYRGGGVPAGYGLGLIGVVAFAGGGIGDLVWHGVFGIEVDLEALLSPTHLVLFASALLVLSSPLRAAWSEADDGPPSMARFLPTLLSTTLVTATVAFFLMELSPCLTNAATADPYRFIAGNVDPNIGGWLAGQLHLVGFASILLTTLVLMGPTLTLLRRWRTPPGSFAILFTTVAGLASALEGFRLGITVFAADLLVQVLAPAVSTSTLARTVGGVVPLVLWLAYFFTLAVFRSVGWSVEFWAGITCLSALAGLGLAVLMTLPAAPGEPAQR